jgi:Pregnancy-associated plasma protein-A/Secretion system C-terminal sorting domain
MRCITFLLILFFTVSARAQRVCATADYVRQQLQGNPQLANAYSDVERQIAQVLQNSLSSRDTFANEVISIPVVVHVLYNTSAQNISDAQVKSQIAVLNNDYRLRNADSSNTPGVFKTARGDVRINFCLARVAPGGYSTNGIIHKYTANEYFMADDGMKYSAQGGADAWDTKQYLNIWVCNIFGRVLGYGTPPGGPADKDGVVIMYDVFGTIGNLRAPFNKGRTTTHEVGHWLGLKHLWGDDLCGDDDVSDTPRQLSYNYGCPAFPRVTNCSPNANGDMFMNFMDYTDDACMNMFTSGQKSRMRALFASGGFRNRLLNAFGCDSTLAQGGPLPLDSNRQLPPVMVKVFPNPAAGFVNISSSDAGYLPGKTLRIFNLQGKQMLQQQLTKSTNKIVIEQLLPGTYILRIGDGSNKTVHKMMRL